MQQVPVEVVLDASVWISRELRADANHVTATAWVNQHLQAGGYFVEPSWFLAEVAAAVSRQLSPQDAAKEAALLRRLRRRHVISILPMSAALMRDTIGIATDHGIRAGDAVYVALANRLAIPIVSFDSDQLTRASNLVTIIKP